MNKNLIIILVAAAAIAFVIFKIMKMMKVQAELIKAQTDMTMAIAIKTGAIQPVLESEKQISSKSKKEKSVESKPASSSTNEQPPLPKKNVILTTAHKRVVKLFDDEVPKTASQLRLLYNKTSGVPVETKKFNSMLWNMKNNKGVINFEKFEDSDSVWGLIEWFELDGENTKLTDEYFNRIKKA